MVVEKPPATVMTSSTKTSATSMTATCPSPAGVGSEETNNSNSNNNSQPLSGDASHSMALEKKEDKTDMVYEGNEEILVANEGDKDMTQEESSAAKINSPDKIKGDKSGVVNSQSQEVVIQDSEVAQVEPLEITNDKTEVDDLARVVETEHLPAVKLVDDDDRPSLYIGDIQGESPIKETLISDYQSYVHPAVYLQHYPNGDTETPVQNEATQWGSQAEPTQTTTISTSQSKAATWASPVVNTKNAANKSKLSVQSTVQESTTHANAGVTNNGKRKSGSMMMFQTVRVRKKNMAHETVVGQFEDANEPPTEHTSTIERSEGATSSNPQSTPQNGLQGQGHSSHIVALNLSGQGGSMYLDNRSLMMLETPQLFNRAMIHAQQQQQIHMMQRQPTTQHEANLMRAELDLVAAYQRMQALKGCPP